MIVAFALQGPEMLPFVLPSLRLRMQIASQLKLPPACLRGARPAQLSNGGHQHRTARHQGAWKPLSPEPEHAPKGGQRTCT